MKMMSCDWQWRWWRRRNGADMQFRWYTSFQRRGAVIDMAIFWFPPISLTSLRQCLEVSIRTRDIASRNFWGESLILVRGFRLIVALITRNDSFREGGLNSEHLINTSTKLVV